MIKDIISSNKQLFASHDDISLKVSITGVNNILLGYFLRNCSLSLNTAFFIYTAAVILVVSKKFELL